MSLLIWKKCKFKHEDGKLMKNWQDLKPNIRSLTSKHHQAPVLINTPRRLRMKSSRSILRSGLMLGLYISVFSRTMAKARMKMVSGLWNCCTTSGLHIQYLWLKGKTTLMRIIVNVLHPMDKMTIVILKNCMCV